MPSYNKFELPVYGKLNGKDLEEIARFQVKAFPLGFRGIKNLTWLLHFFPYITGSIPQFRFEVTLLSSKMGDSFYFSLSREACGESHVVAFGSSIKESPYKESVKDSPIGLSGEINYKILIGVSVEQPEATIISFKALAQEDVFIGVISIISLLLAAGIGSLLTWLLMRGV
jgi:hypothetical protein